MKRVAYVVLEHVGQVDPHPLTHAKLDRVLVVMERDAVHEVKIVRSVEIDVVAAHHHDHFAIHGWTATLRIDDERAVQSLGDMLGQRSRVAMVQVHPERLGVELINVLLAGRDDTRAHVEHAIDQPGVHPVEVDAMGMIALIAKRDSHAVPFAHPDGRAGDAAVVGPRGECDAGYNLDRRILRDEREVPKCLAIRQRAHGSAVKINERLRGIEPVPNVIHFAYDGWHRVHPHARHVVPIGGRGLRQQRAARQRTVRDAQRGDAEQAGTAQASAQETASRDAG